MHEQLIGLCSQQHQEQGTRTKANPFFLPLLLQPLRTRHRHRHIHHHHHHHPPCRAHPWASSAPTTSAASSASAASSSATTRASSAACSPWPRSRATCATTTPMPAATRRASRRSPSACSSWAPSSRASSWPGPWRTAWAAARRSWSPAPSFAPARCCRRPTRTPWRPFTSRASSPAWGSGP